MSSMIDLYMMKTPWDNPLIYIQRAERRLWCSPPILSIASAITTIISCLFSRRRAPQSLIWVASHYTSAAGGCGKFQSPFDTTKGRRSISYSPSPPTAAAADKSTSKVSPPTTTTSIRGMYDVVFVLGPPGSGKGTQCSRIEKHLGFVHLSAGDLLRAERNRPGSLYGEKIEWHIRNGTIVPVQITCSLIEKAMELNSSARGYLVDGFPRNEDNLQGWARQMDKKATVHFVLYLNAPIETCVGRCLGRGQGRSDDNEESIRKRIVTYNTETLPIIEYYTKMDMVREIDGTGSADQVFQQVEQTFKEHNFPIVQ